jgi:cytochrome c oxidase assembly protein subunit 11
MSEARDERRGGRRADRVVAVACAAFVAAMVGAAYAAVPLYQLFCQVTGYGGTTQRAEEAPGRVIDRVVTVRFDANVTGGLPWRFAPEQRSVSLKVGEVAEVKFVAENLSGRQTVATSTFNVTPGGVGSYFAKIQCFCFTEQTLKPGERLEMPVVFYVDPAMDEDVEAKSVRDITLSYTFFPAKAGAPVAAAPPAAEAAKLN